MGEAVHTLSIIIPAYNEEKTIAELLQRVLDADLGTGIERELIVVNDCSTDSTEQIVEDFIARHADAPIVYLKHERNYGKGHGRTHGHTSRNGRLYRHAGCRPRTRSERFQENASFPFIG